MTKISVSRLTDFGANTIIHALSLEIMEAGNETFLRIKISSPSKDINSQSWKKEQLMRQFNILLPFPSQKTCRLIIFYFGSFSMKGILIKCMECSKSAHEIDRKIEMSLQAAVHCYL